MVKTEDARCGHFEEMLKDCIDCGKDNDATSEFFTDMPNVNRMSEGNSSESTDEVEHVVTTITVDNLFDIGCSTVAEEIIVEDVKVFDASSPNSEIVEVMENDSVEELQSTIVDDVNKIITDKHINSKHLLINNEFDTFFDKIPPNNDRILVSNLKEVDTPHVNETPSQGTEDVEIISKDPNNESVSQSNSTKNTTESSITENTTIAGSQPNSTENAVESTNINDNKAVANQVSDKPYKCHICGKFFSRASSLKCHIRLHVEGPDSLLRGSSEPAENNIKSQFVELNTKKEEVVEPVVGENLTNTVPDDETSSNVLNSSRDSCDLTEDDDKREYKCIVCEKTFSRRSSLTCHYKFHPKSSVSKNQDNIPVEIINDENTMEVDRVDESAAKEELYKCDKCPRTFSQKNTYVWHMKMHETNVRRKSADNTVATINLTNGVEDTEMMVDITNDVDLTENNDEKTNVVDLNIYKCHLCPRSFPQLRGLKTHSGVHRRKPPANMRSNGPEILNEIFYEEVSSRKNACCTKNHNHDDEMTKLYKCNVCYRCFCDMNNLKAHLARNHQEEDTSEASDNDLVVEPQNKAVAATNEPRISRKQITPRVDEDFKDQKPPIIIPGLYKCGVCSETFDEIELLGDHVDIHIQAHTESLLNVSDESATEELCCVVCEKTFRSQNALSRHMNEHRRREEEVFVRVTSSGRKIRERRSSEDLGVVSSVKCIPCNRTFETIRAKHIHDSSKHPVEQAENEAPELANEADTGGDNQREKYICDCCNRRWANIRALSRHKGWTKQRSSLLVGENSVAEPIPVDEVDPLQPDPIPVEDNKTESDVSSSVKCACCNELFPNIPALNAHLSGQTNGTATEAAVSSSPNREKKNMANCDSLRDLIKCDRCDKFCSSIPALKLHIISDHSKKSAFQIDGRTFAPNTIVQKTATVPANEPAIQKDKSSTASLVHSPNDISSQSKDEDVEDPVDIQTKVKRSRMSAIQQSTTREELPQHKSLRCDLCDETFKSKQALNNHKSTHVFDLTAAGSTDKPDERADTPEVGTSLGRSKTLATSRDLKIQQNRHASITTVDISPVSQPKTSSKKQNSSAQAAVANHSATDTESEEDLFREYRCSICDKKVSSRKTLRYHREKHFKPGEIDPEFDGAFSCDKCHRRFDKKTSLRVHKAYHTTQEKNSNAPIDHGYYSDLRNGVFKCNDCDREFDTVKGVSMHCTKTHKEPESEPEPEFESEPESESESEAYSCPQCDKSFSCCQGLAGHMSRHKRDIESMCEICNKTFANKSNLRRHRRLVHGQSSDNEVEEEDKEEKEDFSCTQCDRVFTTYRGLNGHMQMHQRYCCSECNLEFSTFRNYQAHLESNHPVADLKSTKSDPANEFECDKCDRSFSSAKSLRGHKAVHSVSVRRAAPDPEPTPVPEFKCTLCDRWFPTVKSLGGHKSMHSRNGEEFEPNDSEAEQPESADEDADNEEEQSVEFPCTRCERFFASARSLANHTNTHTTQDNPLELTCPQPQCERVFISHRALSAHFLTHRPEDSSQRFACPKCKETFPVMKAMYDHFCAKHRRTKKVERVSRRNMSDATSNDTEKSAVSSRSRSQAAPAVVSQTRKTRSKSVGDKVSSRNVKPIGCAGSSESVTNENAARCSQPVNKSNSTRSAESINTDNFAPRNGDSANKDNVEDACASSFGVRKSLRLKSCAETMPSIAGKIDDLSTEVNLGEKKEGRNENDGEDDDDATRDNMQLSCVFNDCSESTKGDAASKPKCDICSLVFDNLKSLAKHLADCHESASVNPIDKKFEFGELQVRIHQCTQCDEVFPSRVGLRRHSLSHSERLMVPWESPSLQLKCPLCPKILPTAIGLKRHCLQIHKISATANTLPNPESAQAEVTRTSNVETQSVEENENSIPGFDRSSPKESVAKTKSVNQTATKRSAKEIVTKQSENGSKRSKTNVDQTITEHLVKEAECSTSNIAQAVAQQSVEGTECSTSKVDQISTKPSAFEPKSSKADDDQTAVKGLAKKAELSKSDMGQTTIKQSAKQAECSMSNVVQTAADQSVIKIEGSKSNADLIATEHSAQEADSTKTNVDQIKADQSVKNIKGSKPNVDQTVTEQSVNESKSSKTYVGQIVTKQTVKKSEYPKFNIDQIVAQNSASKTVRPKSNDNQIVIEQSVSQSKGLKSYLTQATAEQFVNQSNSLKSYLTQATAEQSVNQSKSLKSNVAPTTVEQSVNETKSSKCNVNQTSTEQPKINEPEPEPPTNGIDNSTTDTNVPSSKAVEQNSVPNSETDLPAKVTAAGSTDIQYDHSTDDDADTQPAAVTSAPAKTDVCLSCKICSRQFAHVKAFNKHQQWHKFNDRAVDVDEASTTTNDDSKQRANSNGPLINGTTDLELFVFVKCDICEEKFTKADALKKHAFDVHTVTITSPILYQCNFCQKPFPRGRTLLLHLQSHAPKNCSVVVPTTKSASSCEEIMPFECASCEKCFRLKDDLLEHVKTHLADSELIPSTDEPLVVNGSTEEVPRNVNGDELNTSENSENYELKIHSDDDDDHHHHRHPNDILKEAEQVNDESEFRLDSKIRRFQCPRCNKKFLRQNNLTSHLRSHTILKNERDKPLESKPQPTMRRRSVRLTDDVQMSIISPPKQHQCPLCDESFRSKIILEMHVQKHSTAHVSKQSTAKSSRKSLKRSNECDNFTPDDGLSSSKRVSKEVSRIVAVVRE